LEGNVKKLFAVALVLATGALAPVAHGGGRAETTVTFDDARSSADMTKSVYEGTLSSPRKACEEDRRVIVLREGSEGFEKVASTRTKPPAMGGAWTWRAVEEGALLAGTYLARAKQTESCEGDRSPKLSLWR
jgi:hypothetical protein